MRTKSSTHHIAKTVQLGLICSAGLLLAAAGAQAAEFDVTIYNASPQIFSPPVVVSHRSSVRVFEVGSAPSDELAALAEDADAEALIALLQTTDGVRDVVIGDGVIMPGKSATVRVDAGGNSRVFTVADLPVTTNDTIYSAPLVTRAPGLPQGGPGMWAQLKVLASLPTS